jgi:cell division septum initiation protein DivIVA
MKERLYPWLAAISFLGLLALAYLAFGQRAEIVHINLDLGTADQAAHQRIADLQQQLATAKEAENQAEKQVAQAKAASAHPSAGNGDGNVRTIHISDIVKDHPEYAALAARESRRNILRQYGDALAALNLPPDQLSKMKDLLVERELSTNDAQQAAEAAGLQRGTQPWRDAMQQATDSVDQEMTAVLGTDSHPVFQKLQNESNYLNQIQYNYAPDFSEAGAPLNADQTRALADAMAAARNPGATTPAQMRADYVADPDTQLTPYDNRLLTAAAQVLSPAQLQVLKTEQIQGNQQTAIFRTYMTGGNGGLRIISP